VLIVDNQQKIDAPNAKSNGIVAGNLQKQIIERNLNFKIN